jgi:hypothetical protein
VHADPHLHRPGGKGVSAVSGRRERLDRIGERIQEGVPLRVDLDSLVSREGLTQQTAMLGERVDVALLAQLLDQPRRPFDVGEEEGDGSARKRAHVLIMRREIATFNPSLREADGPGRSRTSARGFEVPRRGLL